MRLWSITIAALVGFAAGCNKSPEGGTPNTSSSFKIALPPMEKDIKQGDRATLDGSIDRGSEFKKDVKLKVEAPPKVDVTLSKDTIKASEGDTKFTLTVAPAKDAPVGEHIVKVTGTPSEGAATVGEFKVKVVAP
jgi:uncharacterized membrane protein